ncbi:MAG: carbamoyltransferase HypF [Bryobacteraceae bacterium]
MATARRQIRIRGVVQGVGFRPFVHKLARRLELTGYVLNSSSGVVVEVEGAETTLEAFVETIRREAPPLASIDEMLVTAVGVQGGRDFVIRESQAREGEFALVSPDVATCPECYDDFTDPENRRFGYPFTNCTNCGPRYTIIRDIPYDRPKTTMAEFRMCAECQAEYDDPGNRRFHAQPNACAVCGPQLSGPIAEAQKRLAAGEVLAIRGLGGFHLACDPRNDAAVIKLRERKRRSDKPFALMARDLAAIEGFCEISGDDRRALESPRRSIVILPRRADGGISAAVAPGNRTLAVMLPYTPLHYLLFEGAVYDVLVMTSGNLSEEPIVISNEEALSRLGPLADWFLVHDRDIYMRTDDSVVRTFEGRERVLRRSRGFVPQAIELGMEVPGILACGGELKNCFCLTKGHHAILSQHIGDMENYETLLFFEETLANLKKLYRVEPRAVAHDLHPAYLSTRYAQGLPELEKVGVQHHHAHVASCMAENGLRGKVIGVAFDGTGYGTDSQIWGGEFLVADYAGFERRAHFRYVPLPGGDAAIRQPWRSALSYLADTFGATTEFPELAPWREVPSGDLRTVRSMISRRVNTVNTSSCGRLFDAVASLLGLRQQINFEGQAAIELEMFSADGEQESYPVSVEADSVDFRPAIERMVVEIRDPVPGPVIAARFHNSVADAAVEVCSRIRQESKLNRVCLSGGSFQNMRLLERTLAGLRRLDFEVFLHAQVPPNDGGISLGQAIIAAEMLRRG